MKLHPMTDAVVHSEAKVSNRTLSSQHNDRYARAIKTEISRSAVAAMTFSLRKVGSNASSAILWKD